MSISCRLRAARTAALAVLLAAAASAAPARAAHVSARPTVASLLVPAESPVGSPPAVSLQLQDPGARSIRVTVAIASLETRRAVVVASLGWVRAGATIAVRWPHGARLTAGHYHVSIHARDATGAPLLRTTRDSGVAALTVAAPAPAPVAPVVTTPPPAQPPAGTPTPADTLADGAVFPVAALHNFGGPENRFGAPRGTRWHQGQDILAAEGSPVVAPLAGSVEWTAYQAEGAGWYAVVHTDFGLDMMFAHCQAGSLEAKAGERIIAGQQICLVGQTGDATTPHLHFELWVGGWQAPGGQPIDPLPYLEAWEAR
jgi:murein DD-endopeptidase MepM/ murein hydrolase activator NlpD